MAVYGAFSFRVEWFYRLAKSDKFYARKLTMSGIYNFTIEQGATFSRTLTWKINSNLVNLTGYSARLKARNNNSKLVVFSLTSPSGITLGGAAGTIVLNVSANDTTKLIPGKYSYDLELQSGGGEVTRLLRGTLTISPEVTY